MLYHTSIDAMLETNFSLIQHHKWSLSDIENMIPWEKDIYLSLLKEHIEEENLKAQQRNNG